MDKEHIAGALIAPIPTTILMDYSLSLLNMNKEQPALNTLFASMLGILLGFIMAYVGHMPMKKFKPLKIIICLIYAISALAGMAALWVSFPTEASTIIQFLQDHARFYLIWGGVYLSCLFTRNKKISLHALLLPALLLGVFYIIDYYTFATAKITTTLRYGCYLIFGLAAMYLTRFIKDPHYVLYMIIYLLIFLFGVIAPIFITLPAVLVQIIGDIYLIYSVFAGMIAYGLSNH